MKRILFGLFLFGLLLFSAVVTNAQVKDFYNVTYTTLDSDTITDTAVTNLRVTNSGFYIETTIQVEVEEISGTGAGTLTLMGSIDGVDYKAILGRESNTALNTYTVQDATGTQTFHWRLYNNPFPYYQIQHSGGTTMSYKFRAKLRSSK